MIKNTRRTLFAMIAVATLTFGLSSPLRAQVSGTAGRSGPSASQNPCSVRTMQELQNAVCQLMNEMQDVQAQLAQSQADLLDTQTSLTETRLELAVAQGDIASLESDLAAAESTVATLQAELDAATSRIDVLEANPVLELAPYVSVENANLNDLVGPHVLFTGVNVHIRSGSGATDDGGALTGLGNLIVGYNESNGDVRTGSHNLVIGERHTYTSNGGLIAGFDNAVTGQEASVLGGRWNTASGRRSSISGGESGVASGLHASIVAGNNNVASGTNSSVTGGIENQAVSPGASVTGGRGNIAGTDTNAGYYSVVSGGKSRTAPGNFDWAAGTLFENE